MDDVILNQYEQFFVANWAFEFLYDEKKLRMIQKLASRGTAKYGRGIVFVSALDHPCAFWPYELERRNEAPDYWRGWQIPGMNDLMRDYDPETEIIIVFVGPSTFRVIAARKGACEARRNLREPLTP